LLVRGRFCGTAANVSVRLVVCFAPTSARGHPNETFAAISACIIAAWSRSGVLRKTCTN